tara:strand:+ start:1656 stop:1916 length:261 start_codon:yes stop_codon:yes gene_type:complete
MKTLYLVQLAKVEKLNFNEMSKAFNVINDINIPNMLFEYSGDVWIGGKDWDVHLYQEDSDSQIEITLYPVIDGKTDASKGLKLKLN